MDFLKFWVLIKVRTPEGTHWVLILIAVSLWSKYLSWSAEWR